MSLTNIWRDFSGDVLVVLLLALPVVAVVLAVRIGWLRKRSSRRPTTNAVLEVGLLMYLAAVAVVTLTPKSYVEESGPRISWDVWVSDVTYGPELVQLLANFVLLIPVVLLYLARFRPRATFAVGAIVAITAPVGIELLQAFVVPGRVAVLEDVVVGAAGGLVAAAFATGLVRLRDAATTGMTRTTRTDVRGYERL